MNNQNQPPESIKTGTGIPDLSSPTLGQYNPENPPDTLPTPEEQAAEKLRMMDDLARVLAEENLTLGKILDAEKHCKIILESTDAYQDYSRRVDARKRQQKHVDHIKNKLRTLYVSVYNLIKDKHAHPSGSIRVKSVYEISDMQQAVEWCISHSLIAFLEITDTQGFCEFIAKMPYSDKITFAAIKDDPRAAINTDLSTFLSESLQPKDE